MTKTPNNFFFKATLDDVSILGFFYSRKRIARRSLTVTERIK